MKEIEQLGYDLNGNIEVLKRHGVSGLIDDLSYDYGTGSTYSNQLLSVTDVNTSDSTSFIDGNTTGDDYLYDANGNMTKDLNKGINEIKYNHLNLPEKVVFSAGDSLLYYYDAAGIKLKQEVYKAGTLETVREYVGEFYYENDTLKFIQHEEGRIVVDAARGVLDYQYHLKDHLGNTRLTFSTSNESYSIKATMEDTKAASEELVFTNLPDTRIVMSAANATSLVEVPGANKAARVDSNDPIGPMTMLKVDKGDTIKLETWAYYEGDGSTDALISAVDLLAALVNGFGDAAGLSEAATAAQGAIDDAMDFPENLIPKTNTVNDDAPKAYINYMFFDEDMAFITSGFTQITTAAQLAKELVIMDPVIIGQNGFIVCYVSNESTVLNYVYFDDFTVTHAKTNVVSADDYYPFGLTFNSFTRSYSEKVRFKFQEQEHDDITGWDMFKWRNHQPEIGRFFNVDPLAEKYVHNSPYAFSENHVTGHRELEGLEKEESTSGNFLLQRLVKTMAKASKTEAPHEAVMLKKTFENGASASTETFASGKSAFSITTSIVKSGVTSNDKGDIILNLYNTPSLGDDLKSAGKEELAKTIKEKGTESLTKAVAGKTAAKTVGILFTLLDPVTAGPTEKQATNAAMNAFNKAALEYEKENNGNSSSKNRTNEQKTENDEDTK